MNYSLNFANITPELFKLSPGARQQSSAAHHAGRQEQGGDRVLKTSHRRSPCVSLDRQPTGQSHQIAEIQSALAQLSRMCASRLLKKSYRALSSDDSLVLSSGGA